MKKILWAVFLASALAQSQTGNGTVAGRILLADGTPAARITVVVTPAASPGQVQISPEALTDTSGKYQINNVSPGKYLVVVLTPGLPVTYYPGEASPEKATAVTVKPGEQVIEINFNVAKQGQILPPRPQPIP